MATISHSRAIEKRRREIVQRLLADRFRPVIHREPRYVSGYVLVVSKKGPKMQAANAGKLDANLHSNDGHLTAEDVTMEALARGGFNFELDWMPDRLDSRQDAASDVRPSIFTAIQEKLGLRLESAQVPIQAIVIDKAENPDEN
jgi:hypothetical protein